MKNKILLFLPILGLFLSLPASAQQQPGPQVVPGARIRVTAPNVSKLKLDREGNVILSAVVGTVVTFEADTLVLKVEGQATPLTVPLASLKKLEVSRGRKKSRALAGAGIGFLGGAVVGYVIGYNTDCGDDCPPAQGGAIVGGIGALGGTLFGALIGANMGGERWEEVPLEKVSMNIMPNSHGGFLI